VADYELKVKAPVCSDTAGKYTEVLEIVLTTSTPEATIHYTIDGSTPADTSKEFIETNPIIINSTTILKALAFRDGWTPSEVTSRQYDIEISGAVGGPVFSPEGGTYFSSQNVSIDCPTPNAEIRYTVDGTEPTSFSNLYSGKTILVERNTTIKARAYKEGLDPSEVSTAVYAIQVEAPSFSPTPDSVYTSAMMVDLSTATSEAVIYYTMDGSEPDSSSIEYEETSFIVDKSLSVRARAFKEGMEPSSIATAVYIINVSGEVSSPVIVPPGGIFAISQTVTMESSTEDAQIRYTTDGSDPDESSALYVSDILVEKNTVIRARAFKEGTDDSRISIASFEIRAAMPEFDPPAGTYTSAQSVTISTTAEEAEIYYTLDESEPDTTSLLYEGPIDVERSRTLKARTYKKGMNPSSVVSATYSLDIEGMVKAPLFSPEGGLYTGPQEVTLTSATQYARIHYTDDGSEPTGSSALYLSPLTISKNTVVKARAYKSDMIESDVSSQEYFIRVISPVINPPGGEFTTVQVVTITCQTDSASIYFTLNGNEPDSNNSQLYEGPILANDSVVIKARAYKTGLVESLVKSAEFSITVPNWIIILSPNGGEEWGAGTNQDISWTSAGQISDVKIEYITEKMPSWETIIDSAPNDGNFRWTVPDIPTNSALIRISDVAGDAEDTSDQVFVILP
jgi:hypothetical protein